ncbi:hypothetical protein DPMN_022914 [Dreissena polymorpha]|uniref:Uncharacterized protein n=1 Tax=Dreissena polymorpha TaxID=45954 RepID=A0A9D4LM24_DREPO|nr:hypothetical protein DPMN_022914 [Dreissena polymorpha]
MQEFTFQHPLPHKLPSPLRCSITIVYDKNSQPLFKTLATGLLSEDSMLDFSSA